MMLPELMFRGQNPLLLTESGDLVTKNLVADRGHHGAHTGSRAVTPAEASTASTQCGHPREEASDASSSEPQPVTQQTA
jgi:hypothetical protein